jgi:cephalosporin hydroxylase
LLGRCSGRKTVRRLSNGYRFSMLDAPTQTSADEQYASRIQMIQGSSIAPEAVAQVREIAAGYERVLVCLDSNHTHAHVVAELDAYAPLTSLSSYCVVFDTIVVDVPADTFLDRPWGPGDNPRPPCTNT